MIKLEAPHEVERMLRTIGKGLARLQGAVTTPPSAEESATERPRPRGVVMLERKTLPLGKR
jgi:hypothetical protein